MKPIYSQYQMAKFGKFAEKLTTTQSVSPIIWNVKCVTKKKHIGKTKGDNTKESEVRINQHISDCKIGDSTCKFPCHVYDCGIKNNCLEEPFFNLNIMFRLNKSGRLETIEKNFHLKGYDKMNNLGRN